MGSGPVLSEWEAREARRGSATAAARALGVSRSTIYRMRRLPFRCSHCGARFATRTYALDHFLGLDRPP